MDQLIRMMQESILFSDLSEETIEKEILPHGRIQDIPKGNHLISFQEKVDYFGIVISGKFNLLHIYGNGDFGIMGVLEPGDLWGIDLMYTRSRISPYYAQAMLQTRVLTFSVDMILSRGVLPELTRLTILEKLLMMISDENMRKEYRLAILFQKGLRDRIMTFLTMQANKRHSDTFSVPFTRDEMASYLCVNRTCLSHELSLMEQEGILTFHRNTFTLQNWDHKNGEY
ncbi:MAG: Crp/Fnr family transcriptional regulator [Oscillospiraceae bacterium]|nr:Crp/Fnr family transcriptional regulator [Oscillospiraceae bacterium]